MGARKAKRGDTVAGTEGKGTVVATTREWCVYAVPTKAFGFKATDKPVEHADRWDDVRFPCKAGNSD